MLRCTVGIAVLFEIGYGQVADRPLVEQTRPSGIAVEIFLLHAIGLFEVQGTPN